MKQSLSIAFIVAAALASGSVLAQDKAAAAKAAAKSTQVAQAGAAATSAGSASAGAATTAAGAAANFGTAVISAVPHIGIAAGMTAVGSAASDQSSGAATQH
jgi:hypothetical protein